MRVRRPSPRRPPHAPRRTQTLTNKGPGHVMSKQTRPGSWSATGSIVTDRRTHVIVASIRANRASGDSFRCFGYFLPQKGQNDAHNVDGLPRFSGSFFSVRIMTHEENSVAETAVLYLAKSSFTLVMHVHTSSPHVEWITG